VRRYFLCARGKSVTCLETLFSLAYGVYVCVCERERARLCLRAWYI